MEVLTLEKLKKAVSGEYAAVRRTTRLEPQGEKVFPPTYEGGEYADETRVVAASKGEGDEKKLQVVETVLLDSVQSQANRMELALLRAYDAGHIKMPLLQVDFAAGGDDPIQNDPIMKEVGRLTALEAPHRMCDAIFRDSMNGRRPFREAGIGAALTSAKSANATPVFEICPTALLFGFWDSTGPRGGLGAKVQRAIVSEIVGYQSLKGKRPASRIDPLQIQISDDLDIYSRQGGGWTFDEGLAVRENGAAVKLAPSKINHGNITPSLRHEDKKSKKWEMNHGGVTLAYAVQHTVLSLAALRRLRFPVNGSALPKADEAARVVLVALGLAAICLLDEDGYDLRSRCLLDGKPGVFQFVGRGETHDFDLDSSSAAELLAQAVAEAKQLGLPWPEQPVTLTPSLDLSRLVVNSRHRSMSESAGG